jgi:H+/Cl- antiporter ClcA
LINLPFINNRNERLKTNILQAIPFWVASLITGLIAVFYTKIFALAEKLSINIFHSHAWLMFIISPVCFVLARWIVKKYAPFSRGSGIPQVMASVELSSDKQDEKIKKLLSLRIILVKIISSMLMAFGGGAVGKEGPIIHIAGSVFKTVNNLLPAWWPKVSKKNMIMTGAAAGLAAAFNTPLGGIVFAVEELTKVHLNNFKTSIFTAVIIAGLTVQSLLGSYLYLGFPVVTSLSSSILFGVILVAILSGLMGGGMGKIIWMIFKWKSTFKKDYYNYAFLLFGSLAIVSLAFFVNEGILGSGKSLMESTLFTANKYSNWYMPLLRIIGSVFSFTTGASGGIFAPGLSCGGSIGSVISGWFSLSSSDTNVLILAGMAAFLTGITRAPFTSAILVLEMTDRNNLILHLMLASIIANIIAKIIDKHSLYEYLKVQYLREVNLEDNEQKKEENTILLVD